MTIYYYFFDESWGQPMPFDYFFFDTYIGYLLQIVPIALLAAMGCFLARKYLLHRRSGRSRELGMALFAGYAAALGALVLTPSHFLGDLWYLLIYHQGGPSLSDLPLLDVSRWEHTFHFGGLRGEAFGNLLLFVPLGLFLCLLWPRLEGRTLLIALGVSAAVEILQMPIGRSFDVRDLISNTLGAAIGFVVGLLLRRLSRRAARATAKGGRLPKKQRGTD